MSIQGREMMSSNEDLLHEVLQLSYDAFVEARDMVPAGGYMDLDPTGRLNYQDLLAGLGSRLGALLAGREITATIVDPTPNQRSEFTGVFSRFDIRGGSIVLTYDETAQTNLIFNVWRADPRSKSNEIVQRTLLQIH